MSIEVHKNHHSSSSTKNMDTSSSSNSKRPPSDSEDDDVPLIHRKKVKTEIKQEVKKRSRSDSDDSDGDYNAKKKVKSESKHKDRNGEYHSKKKDKDRSESKRSKDRNGERHSKKKSKSESKHSKDRNGEHKKKDRSESKHSKDSNGDYSKKKIKSEPQESPSKHSSGGSTNSSPVKKGGSTNSSPVKKGRKVKAEEEEVWKWWEEKPRDDGVKWNFLEHKGPVFASPYEPLPKHVTFKYNGKPLKLSQDAEEIAGFYARFIEHDYTTKEKFNTNFFKDWRKSMTKAEKETITDLKKCNFTEINEHYKLKTEERKGMSKEEKLQIKEENEAIQKEYGTCTLDGHAEKIGNFKIEPPGLFRGRGDHPKMGMLKRRVVPEDVIINCSKAAKVPSPPPGHKWKEVRHDNTVTWLACWTENVQGQSKYVMLNPTSRLKGEKDWMKYEKARELAKHIDKIRENYKLDFKSKEMRVRQRAVALYFIDKLALRAGNEKDEDQADTVGCCSLRYEHIKLYDEKDDMENVVAFDFLGKDSIRYSNEVPVEKRVYKNLKIFMDNKKPGDDLFDRLNTQILNKHLSELMDGLTAKVFRTYNASHTLQQQLDELTPKDGTPAEKILAYNRANRAVAILCNHQRAVPKSHEKSMENLDNKISTKKKELKQLKKELKEIPKGHRDYEKKSNARNRLQQQLDKLQLNKTDKEEGKEIALGTSKLNYLDPRITVAWCKKYDVPVEKVYNKTQRAKFRWAIDMIMSSKEKQSFRFD